MLPTHKLRAYNAEEGRSVIVGAAWQVRGKPHICVKLHDFVRLKQVKGWTFYLSPVDEVEKKPIPKVRKKPSAANITMSTAKRKRR